MNLGVGDCTPLPPVAGAHGCDDGGRHSVEFERVSFKFMPLTSEAINEVNGKVEGVCPQCALFCKQ